uniref:Uncharacterized protein n=1 Tax=Oryza rufipogon TaxID=4529 RepID=A0A0E0RDD4_ORYRU
MGDHGRRRQAAAPLLEKKGSTGTGVDDGYCIEGCPGCVVDRRKAASYGIPYGSFLFVWIVTLCTDLCTSYNRSILAMAYSRGF